MLENFVSVQMNRLPKETFLLITEYLDFEEKFQFSLTCKNWHATISNHNLYKTVFIERDHKSPITFFQQHKLYGSTVKSLQVDGVVGLNFSHIKEWPGHFPNLQNLSLSIAEADMFSSDYEEQFDDDENCYEGENECFKTTSKSFKAWKRLSTMSEHTKFMYTGSILKSGFYPNLIVIDLNFNLIPYNAVNTVINHLFASLKNAPNLKYFKLIGAQLTLNQLRTLQYYAPNIEALILEDISSAEETLYDAEAACVPDTIATNLKRLEMQGNRHSFYESEEITIPQWLAYISQNYPNIEVLKMNQYTPASIEYETALINVVSNCTQLKTFNVDFCSFSKDVLSAFDNTAIQLEKYSTQSQDLTELRNLSLSKQRHSIYRLDLVIPIGNTDLVDILNQFTALTTINTYPSSDIDYAVGNLLQVPLNTLLKHQKQLTFLSLSSCVLFIDHDSDEADEEINSVLDTLEMEKVLIKPSANYDFFDFISKSCSQLKVMILTAKFSALRLENPTVLDFSNHAIEYMKVYIEGYTHINLLQNTEHPNSTWYQIEKVGRKIKYVKQEEESLLPTDSTSCLKISSQCVKRFVLNIPRDPFELL
ncbi:unnamed protein product [Mucor hiemalis]